MSAPARRASTRRRRAHDATVDEIKDNARVLLADQGPAALSLSAVARRLGIVPSGLYRYFASREDLLAALTVDAWGELLTRLEAAETAAADRTPVDRLRRVAHEWRGWALDNPEAFALMFGAPSEAHYTDAVLAAASRTGRMFGRLIGEALAARGAAPGLPVPDGLRGLLARPTGDPDVGAVVLSGRLRLQGHITAEVFGHLPDVDPEQRTALYDFTVTLLLREAGLA